MTALLESYSKKKESGVGQELAGNDQKKELGPWRTRGRWRGVVSEASSDRTGVCSGMAGAGSAMRSLQLPG